MKTSAEKQAYNKAYRLKNREKLNSNQRTWRAAHKEEIKAINRRNYIKSERSNQYQCLYGISEKDFEMQIVLQNNRCPIGNHLFGDRGKKNDSPCQDHDHSTGTVRMVLCNRHNVALGGFRDNVDELRAAVKYLECYQAKLDDLNATLPADQQRVLLP